MKNRRSILWICAGIIAVLALLIWFAERPVSSNQPADAQLQPKDDKNTIEELKKEEIAPSSRRKVTAIRAADATNSKSIESKEERTRTVLSELNDVPIIFYGKLEDQFNNPVAGAEVTGSILFDNGLSSGVRDVKTVSDFSGLFQFNDGKGERLSVTPRKSGYAIASTNAAFKYSHFYPDVRHIANPAHPTVIRMWKLQGAEPLVHFQFKARIPCNGEPVIFDLQTGKNVEFGGDIVIRIESPLTPNVLQRYDWKATIQPVAGGVIPFSGVGFEKMFQAPETDYDVEWIIGDHKDAKPWSSRFNGGFYFKSRDGRCYGKGGLSITTDMVKNGSVPITLSGYINPTGSRNLEIDSALVRETKP